MHRALPGSRQAPQMDAQRRHGVMACMAAHGGKWRHIGILASPPPASEGLQRCAVACPDARRDMRLRLVGSRGPGATPGRGTPGTRGTPTAPRGRPGAPAVGSVGRVRGGPAHPVPCTATVPDARRDPRVWVGIVRSDTSGSCFVFHVSCFVLLCTCKKSQTAHSARPRLLIFLLPAASCPCIPKRRRQAVSPRQQQQQQQQPPPRATALLSRHAAASICWARWTPSRWHGIFYTRSSLLVKRTVGSGLPVPHTPCPALPY